MDPLEGTPTGLRRMLAIAEVAAARMSPCAGAQDYVESHGELQAALRLDLRADAPDSLGP